MARRTRLPENGPKTSVSPQEDAVPDGLPAAVERWFAGAARDLPWRRARSGYHALVSELMLQQTQVARVLERFEPFVARFPTAAALAAAPEDEVLAAWQGLGYYRRARLLHQAAKAVVERHGGEVPAADHAALLALPGVGRYTAGAIASTVAGLPVPIVDGNVMRVFQRLAAREGSASDREVVDWAWREAARFAAAAESPAAANEGLMELGATVCTPSAPRCDACPASRLCAARRDGRTAEIPAPKAAISRRELVLVSARVMRAIDDALLLEQRPREGLWGGLWQPPTVECADGGELAPRAAGELLGLHASLELRAVGEVPFMTTHRAVRFIVFEARAGGAGARLARGGRRWVARGELGAHALSNAARRVLFI